MAKDPNKKYTEEEIARRAVTGQTPDPLRGDTPQARTTAAVKGMAESVGIYKDQVGKAIGDAITSAGGFLRDSAVTAANTGVMGNMRDAPGAGMLSPEQQGLRRGQVNLPQPTEPPPKEPQAPAAGNAATDSTPVQTSTPATGGGTSGGSQPDFAAANNVEALRKMGVKNPEMAAVGGGQQGRRAVINAGSSEFVNLGNYGQTGQGNIYGKSSTPGGRMDTFVGAGPNAGKLNEQGQVVTGGGVYNPTGYNPQDPYGLRSGRVAPARAGGRQFPGSGGLRMTEIRRINSQANRAFNQALESGMNTKAATRIADSIRAGAGALTAQDQNAARRYASDNLLEGTIYGNDTQLAQTALREQGSMTRAQAQAQTKMRENQFNLFRDQFVDPETGKRDDAGFSRMVQNAGGYERFLNAAPETQQRLATRGSGLNQLLGRFNEFANREGINYSTIGELTQGMKLAKTDTTIIDALTSGNIDIFDIWGEKVELPDGSLYNVSDVFSDANGNPIVMSKEDWAGLVDLEQE